MGKTRALRAREAREDVREARRARRWTDDGMTRHARVGNERIRKRNDCNKNPYRGSPFA